MAPGDSDGFDENRPQNDQLEVQLRSAGWLDPVPSSALAAARSIFAWRTIDAELAELAYDSLLDPDALAGVRGTQTPTRLLTFEGPSLTLEVETVFSGPRRRLVGQLVPPRSARLDVHHPGGTVATSVDAVGCFSIEGIIPGPVSIHVHLPGGAVVVTSACILV